MRRWRIRSWWRNKLNRAFGWFWIDLLNRDDGPRIQSMIDDPDVHEIDFGGKRIYLQTGLVVHRSLAIHDGYFIARHLAPGDAVLTFTTPENVEEPT